MKLRGSLSFLALLAGIACAAMTPACEGFHSSSKVAQGQRYQSDDSRYDPFFDNVHQSQVAAAAWPDEKKATRKPLINALALTPGASDDTILDATRERAKKLGGNGAKLDLASAHVAPSGGSSDAPLFAAVEETVRLELERARKLKDKSDKLEELAKHGEELKKNADKEFENRGADKADEKKTEKSREIRRELGGSVDVLRKAASDATKLSKDAQDFLDDLGTALEAKPTPHGRDRSKEAKPLPPPPADPKALKPAKPAETKKPAAKPAAKPPETPAAKPPETPAEKPAPKPPPPPDEVFNP